MSEVSMDYEVWFELRKQVLQTLDDLAYWQGRYDSGVELNDTIISSTCHLRKTLGNLMSLAKTACCVESGEAPLLVSYADVYKWLRIDFETSYLVLYESCKKRFFE